MKSCESGSSIGVWKDGPCGEFMNDPLVPAATVKILSSFLIDSSFRCHFSPIPLLSFHPVRVSLSLSLSLSRSLFSFFF